MKAFFLALAARLKNIRPKGGGQLHLTRGDALLLRWVVLCVVVLLATMLMLLTGAFEWVDTVQLKVLCGSPFYLEAEATQYSALSPGAMFALCTAITLYLAVVLLRYPSFIARMQVVVLALMAALMPGLLCVLWDCVFYAAAPVFCIMLSWLLVSCMSLITRKQS